jgi:hypothetical protein
MLRSRLVVVLAALCVLVVAAPAEARIERRDRSDATVVFPQDVSVIVGSTLREPNGSTDPSAPLFNDSGINLGITWGQWQGAGGKAVARVRNAGSDTKVELNLTGLVPGGVYSVFWGTLDPDSEHPGCPGVERSQPLTSVKGERQVPDPSSFVARPNGRASYDGVAPGNILAAGQTFFWVIFQSDGQADHPFPNLGEKLTAGSDTGCRSSFGLDAMRQLTILMRS